MSDRIQKLKNESRRLPKSPNQNGSYGGPRRISHGIIGVRKVRRSSGKSNTSTGSKGTSSNNPFSDLVLHQSRSSISVRSDRGTTSGLERKARRSKSGLDKSIQEGPSASLTKSQSQSINHLLATSIANQTATSKYDSIQSPKLPAMDSFAHTAQAKQSLEEGTDFERDIPIRLDRSSLGGGGHDRPSISTLEDGFVQQDDEQAMENMAMDKIDRFLESLGSESGKPPILPPITPSTEADKTTLTAALKSTINTEAISPETRQLVTQKPKKPIPEPLKTPDSDRRSIHSWATTSAGEEELKSPSIASTPSIRPLSIVKSPSNPAFARSQGPTADPDETFRGVKVAWLIEMYHDYMAEKSRRTNEIEEQKAPIEAEKISPSSKGLRPLLLPSVVATAEAPAKAADNMSLRSVDSAASKRPGFARGLTFGAPRTPVNNATKGSATSSSSGPHSKSPPTLQRSVTGLPPMKDPKPSPPPFKRTDTGLTQQDAVQVARTKMNAALNMSTDHFIDQVIEATALLSPTRSTFRGLDGDERAIAKQHVSPVRDTFSSPKAYSPPAKSSSPPLSAILPALARDPEAIVHKVMQGEAIKRDTQKRPPKLNLAKQDDRKCIVTNNVAFFDPFGAATPRPQSPISPTLSEANLRMNRQFLEGINSMDTGLASSLGSRVAAKLSPPLIHGESGLKNMQTKEVAESAKTSVSEAASAQSAAEPVTEQELPLMLQEDSTSEDDELLPKLRPRFEGLGVSSKAQKLLGMSEAKKSVKSRAAKSEYPLSRPTNTETNKLHGRATSSMDNSQTRPVSRHEKNPTHTLSSHGKQPSTSKPLVEPFDEAKYTSQLSKSLAQQAPYPEIVKVKSHVLQKVPASTASSRAANADFDQEKAKSDTKQASANTGLISIKIGESVSANTVSQVSQSRPQMVSQASSHYPTARSPPQPSYGKDVEKALPKKKTSPIVFQAAQPKPTSPVERQEPKTYGPFANYRINQDISPSNIAQGHASMSPNSTVTQAVSPSAAQPRTRETGFRVSTTSRSPPSPQSVTTPTEEKKFKKPSVYYDQPPSPNKTSPPALHAQDRKISRGKHGRLSVIEHGPIDINASGSAASVHGLGLGMSPTAPAPAHVFEQILHSEKAGGHHTRPVASRSSTLDRINKSATPSALSKSGSSADGRSEHSIEHAQHHASHRRAPSDQHVKTAVPISYYQPRANKESLDPFRNLDMKTVAAPSKTTAHETKTRPLTYGYFSSAREQDRDLGGRAGIDAKSESSDTSATDVERNYTTRVADLAPDSLLSPRTHAAPRLMNDASHSHPRQQQQQQQQQQVRKARPATMMAAREVHEKFDIRRALARSDDGQEDEYDAPPPKTYDAPEEVFGAFANTATQAFSKWFG